MKMNNTLLNNQCVIKEIRGDIKLPRIQENENTTYQTLWKTAKIVLKEKFIAMITHSKKSESS
jgi:hypothetical protein